MVKRVPDSAAGRVARELTGELVAAGAEAVVLLGSHARGAAHRHSDIDLYALGPGPAYRLERRGDFLVAVSWRTAAQEREAFLTPARAGGAIPAWRRALLLADPAGSAAALVREARDWTWDAIGRARCDAWVAEEVTGYAEEVQKLVGSLALRQTWTAAVQRAVLALRLAPILAVHRRLLYETENQLWALVAAALGKRWARAQGVALGAGGEPFERTCAAALELYGLAALETRRLLDRRQHAVVAHACALAGHPLPDDSGAPA